MTADDSLFLRSIVERPSDLLRRRVYADYLEELGDEESLARAEYLRLECELDEAVPPQPGVLGKLCMSYRRQRATFEARQAEILERLTRLNSFLIGFDWLQMLDTAEVTHCVTFAFKCPRRWDSLALTDDDGVRWCDGCRKRVHYCNDRKQALDLAAVDECVAVRHDWGTSRAEFAEALETHMVPEPESPWESIEMGMLMMPPPPVRIPIPMRGQSIA